MTPSGTPSGSRAARGRSCGRWKGRDRADARASRSPAILLSGFYGGQEEMRRYHGGIVFLLLAAACSSKPAAIDVSPRTVKIYGLKKVQRLTGCVMDKKGVPLRAGTLQWSSSKSDVVAVDSSGKLQSLKEGRSIVTGSFEKLSAQVTVEVVDVKSIEIAPASAHLVGPAGTTIALTAVVKNAEGKAA